MNRNYTPYLKFCEFDDDYKSCHFNTENEFFEIQSNYNSNESSHKNYKNNNKRHLSEYEEIIPQEYFSNENQTIFSNDLFIDQRGLTGKKNLGRSLNNIHFNDINYRKYISNLKNEGSSRSKSKKMKKSKSKNKNIPNYEAYNIIQIYEAPPLELTPIMEIEKYEERRKPPKYYRKKTIYSLEDENEKNNEENNDNNSIKINYLKYKNSSLLRRSKLSNSKINKEILNENDNNNYNSNREKDNGKYYLKFLTKENKTKNEITNFDDTSSINKRKDFRRFIKFEREKDNIMKYTNSTDNINKYNTNNKDLSYHKNEKETPKGDIEINIKDKEVGKKIKKKNYVSQRNNRFNAKLVENQNNKQNINEFKNEDSKNNSINEINKVDKINNNGIKFRNSYIENNKKITEIKYENKFKYKINETKKSKNILATFDYDNPKYEDNKLIKNSTTNLNKNTEPNNYEIKLKNEKPKENKINKQNKIGNSYFQIKENSNLKNLTGKNKLKIEVEKTQSINNKMNYIYTKSDKEGASMKDIIGNKKNNEITNNNKNKNNHSKYVFSNSVEKKNPNEIKENSKNNFEKKKNDINNNQIKNNEHKEKEIKNIYDFKNQIKAVSNNNFSTICTKKDIDNKKEKNLNNNIRSKKEINISKINNTSLVNDEKKNYSYISTVIITNKKEEEKNKNNENIINTKENTLTKQKSKIEYDKEKLIKNKIINEEKKENKKNLSKLDVDIESELTKDNNIKILNNTLYKGTTRGNHNYIAIKTTLEKNKPKKEKIDKTNVNKDKNNNTIKNISSNNTIEIKGVPSNLSSSNITDKIKINNNIIKSINKENDENIQNENNLNINNILSKKIPTIESEDIKSQLNQNENKQKKKIIKGKTSNHSIKVSYGSTTFKNLNDKKEKENEKKDSNNNINNSKDINLKSRFSYKANYNNSNLNKSNENENIKKNDEKQNDNSKIENLKSDKKIQIRAKNNHSLYVSINSKK